MAGLLDDLPAARAHLPTLAGRDPVVAGRGRAGPGHRGVGRGEHLRRRGRAAGAGAPSPGCRGCWPTARSTPWTRWSGTGRRGTPASAGPRPARTTSPTGCRPGSPPRSPSPSRRWSGGSPSGALAALAAGRRGAPQPELRPLRGRGGRARWASGWAARNVYGQLQRAGGVRSARPHLQPHPPEGPRRRRGDHRLGGRPRLVRTTSARSSGTPARRHSPSGRTRVRPGRQLRWPSFGNNAVAPRRRVRLPGSPRPGGGETPACSTSSPDSCCDRCSS